MIRVDWRILFALVAAVGVLTGVVIGDGCSRSQPATSSEYLRRADSLQGVVDNRGREIERLKGAIIDHIDTLPRRVQDSLIDVWLRL